MSNSIYDELLNDEQVLWEGMPQNRLFTTSDIYMIPFSIIWGGFAIFWELSAIRMNTPIFFKLWGIPFVLMGLYMIFGRFIYKSYLNKNTYYYVTNKRVIIKQELRKTKVTSLSIDKLETIEKHIKNSGEGTIRFGRSAGIMDMYTNTGLDFFARGGYWNRNGASAPAFYNIEDAENVYRLIYSKSKGE